MLNIEVDTKIAIIHYWLINMRGGEKVLEALLEIFPGADIYTHVYNKKNISEKIKSHKIFTTFINRLPFADKLYQYYLPLMPKALSKLDLQKYDFIISSESGPAKGVTIHEDAYHICYCHTPMRYVWDLYNDYLKQSNFIVKFFMRLFIPYLRIWDIQTSEKVNCFIANSEFVAKRIRRYYNKASKVIYPPVSIEKYLSINRKPNDFYLFFGQLTKYKRYDIAIEACLKIGRSLIVVGGGLSRKEFIKYGKNGLIKFTGSLPDPDIIKLLSEAKALLFPGIEDFGIIPVEAMAAGCPVIAYRRGGAMETVLENVTGLFFDEQTVESLVDAIIRFEKQEKQFNDRDKFKKHVQQFSKDEFLKKIKKVIYEEE
ncbi:glycosyl transferase [Spirochaetia bacterium]|nr:glycosyl transferase [Spirochaetia bacterium]